MRSNVKLFVFAGVLLALALALFVAPWADRDPDGMTRVAQDSGLAGTERAHDLEDSPVAGYEVEGVKDPRLSTAMAGAIGVLATFGITVLIMAVMRSVRTSDARLEDRR